jgi:ribose 1,5-bisphosphokinase PhnN
MDVSLVQNKNQLSYFEISIEITEKLSSGFIVQVSRASLTQIYSVSIGFVGI